MPWQNQQIPWRNDGIALATAQTLTADGVAGAAIFVGRGAFDIAFTASITVEAGTDFDICLLIVQANTLAATTTWLEIGNLCLGDALGRGVALTTVTRAVIGVTNDGDNQIRLFAYLQGSVLTATITAIAYPRVRKED